MLQKLDLGTSTARARSEESPQKPVLEGWRSQDSQRYLPVLTEIWLVVAQH